MGDYSSLTARIAALRDVLSSRAETESVASAEAVEASRAARIAIVERVETLAATDRSERHLSARAAPPYASRVRDQYSMLLDRQFK